VGDDHDRRADSLLQNFDCFSHGFGERCPGISARGWFRGTPVPRKLKPEVEAANGQSGCEWHIAACGETDGVDEQDDEFGVAFTCA